MKHPMMAAMLAAALGVSFAGSAAAMTQGGCERGCEKILDSMTRVTQSGKLSREYEACMRACADLGAAQEAYKSCIKGAHSAADKEKCREGYRKNRPTDPHTY